MFGFPAAATSVGNQSRPDTIWFSTLPAGTLPGQRRIIGTRKPPSRTVPLPPGEGGLAAVGPREVFGTVVGGKADDRVVVDTQILDLLHHRTDDVVELRHAGFFD